MSLPKDLIFFENPTIWNDFGGDYGGFGAVVWQMFIWSLIVGLLVAVWMIYNLIYFRHADGDPDHKDALKAGVSSQQGTKNAVHARCDPATSALLLVTKRCSTGSPTRNQSAGPRVDEQA